MILLTVHLKDGRALSGRYSYWEAFHRLTWAKDLAAFVGYDWTEI